MSDESLVRLQECARGRRTARGLVLDGANLRGARLAGLRADGLALQDADLRDSVLAGVRWRACVLRDARLENADLSGAALRLCALDAVRAMRARLDDARLENSSARGARFDGASLCDAVLTDSDFSRTSFQGAAMEGVSASGCDLRGADLRGACLRGAMLADADLRGADLRGADLRDADLGGARLDGALLDQAAPPPEPGAVPEPADELRALSHTMAPIVQQVLQAAGKGAVMPPETARLLIDQAERLYRAAPGTASAGAPGAAALQAVSNILTQLGGGFMPALVAALRRPQPGPPPPELQAAILALRKELGLGEGATTEDVLAFLTSGPDGRPP